MEENNYDGESDSDEEPKQGKEVGKNPSELKMKQRTERTNEEEAPSKPTIKANDQSKIKLLKKQTETTERSGRRIKNTTELFVQNAMIIQLERGITALQEKPIEDTRQDTEKPEKPRMETSHKQNLNKSCRPVK